MSERYIVVLKFALGLGWVSEILDTHSTRRILVAGPDHEARARRRAEDLNRATAAKSA